MRQTLNHTQHVTEIGDITQLWWHAYILLFWKSYKSHFLQKDPSEDNLYHVTRLQTYTPIKTNTQNKHTNKKHKKQTNTNHLISPPLHLLILPSFHLFTPSVNISPPSFSAWNLPSVHLPLYLLSPPRHSLMCPFSFSPMSPFNIPFWLSSSQHLLLVCFATSLVLLPTFSLYLLLFSLSFISLHLFYFYISSHLLIPYSSLAAPPDSFSFPLCLPNNFHIHLWG